MAPNTIYSFVLAILSLADTRVTGMPAEPAFRSKPNTFRIAEGGSTMLPCFVDNLGDHTVVWRKGHQVLAAGAMLIIKDDRFKLHDTDNTLELSNIEPQDAGDFVCQISLAAGETLEIAHTVEVLVPPRVRPRPEDGNIVVKKGTEVTLECSASGNPVPTITWNRENDHLPEGHVSGPNSHGYTIRKVDRFDAGRYSCTANNKVGLPATAYIALQVLYEPEIDVEAEKVHSGVGKEAHLTCIVHGEPRPSVRWFKENSELSSNDRIKIESKESSHRHTLILRGLASQRDFGNYSCVAENSLGSSKRHIEVHGRPTPAVFRKKPRQAGKNSYLLVWTVDSYTPIQEYRLLYRQIKPFHPNDGMGGLNIAGGNDWTNIIIPGDARSAEFHHEKTFLLADLANEAQYECLVQAKNQYGWSEASRIHRFLTASHAFAEQPAARDLGWTSGTSQPSSSKFSVLFGLLSSSLVISVLSQLM